MRNIVSPISGFPSPFGQLRDGGGSFSPAVLFANNEPGVWYDPSDLSTLFQDTAGTTPVTTAGQTVGLILDKSGNGLNATQATAAARPTYGIVPETGRRNLLTFTEEFNNAVWTKSGATITANATTAPDGVTTADTLVESTSTSFHYTLLNSVSVLNRTVSLYAKNAGRRYLSMSHQGGPSGFNQQGVIFDLESGTITTQPANFPNASISDAGDGWYRLTISFGSSFTGTAALWFALAQTGSGPIGSFGLPSYTGDGTSGIYIWGAQLEEGSTATAYQKVTTALDVTEAGVTSLGYLSFDGVDDWMVTPTITPGVDKAQVFAGAKANADVTAIILEHSVNTGTNNGSLALYRDSTGYGFDSKGTTLRAANVTTGFSSPDDSVLRGLGDISGDNSQVFRNQSLLAENTADQGTGNFLAYPMYIGSRGGTSLHYNGQIYSLITRFGANLEVTQIESTEAYVAGKTGVTL